MVTVRVALVLFLWCVFAKAGVNGIKATVTGGNVQLSPDQKTLTLQLQLDGSTGTPMTTGGGVGGGVGGGAGGGAGGGVGGGAIGAAVGGAVVGVDGEFTSEEKVGLETHNKFRGIHGVPLMTLDRQMCDQAKAYAQKIAQMGALMHSSKQQRQGQGENLSMGCSTNKAQAMEEAVTNWYNEVCDPGYNFNGGGGGGTGHFTQVVWKGSTVLGIGRAEIEQNGMKCAYIVGRYKPAGNWAGEYAENVPKGSFDKASYCASVRNEGAFDKPEQGVSADSPMTRVNVPVKKTGPAEFRSRPVLS